MRRPARLSKPSLDDLFQRGFTEHEPACRKRLAERKRPAQDRKGVRFSPAFAHRFTLRDGTRDRHSSHWFAGTDRKTARLFFWEWPAPQRGAHAGLLRAHTKHLPGHGTHYGAICKRICHKQDPFSVQFSSADANAQNSRGRFFLRAQQAIAPGASRSFSQRPRADDASI